MLAGTSGGQVSVWDILGDKVEKWQSVGSPTRVMGIALLLPRETSQETNQASLVLYRYISKRWDQDELISVLRAGREYYIQATATG